MTIQLPASRIILQVERAIEEVRRGRGVLLMNAGASLLVVSGEHHPHLPATNDPTHPAVQLMKFAGLLPTAVIAAPEEGQDLLPVCSENIAAYPGELATQVARVSEASVPLADAANTRIIAYRPRFGHEEHLAVIVGDIAGSSAPLVRVHSSCVTGDIFSSLRCDCGTQLHKSLQHMQAEGAGILLYLSQEGRGIGIANKLRAYALQDQGMDTVESNLALGFAADERDFAVAAAILRDLGLSSITLLTNNPLKIEALTRHSIRVAARMELTTAPTAENKRYLTTKARKMGHLYATCDKD